MCGRWGDAGWRRLGCCSAASLDRTRARHRGCDNSRVRSRDLCRLSKGDAVKMIRIAIGFVLSFIIGAGCRYFDIPAASPPVIPGALIVLAMTLGYSSMDRVLVRKSQTPTTKHLCGGPTGLPIDSKAARAEPHREDDHQCAP